MQKFKFLQTSAIILTTLIYTTGFIALAPVQAEAEIHYGGRCSFEGINGIVGTEEACDPDWWMCFYDVNAPKWKCCDEPGVNCDLPDVAKDQTQKE